MRVYENEKLIKEIINRNLVVNSGLDVIVNRLGGSGASNYAITKIGFGTGSAAPDGNDISFINQFTKAHAGCTYPSTGIIKFDWALETYEFNGFPLTEYGLFINDGATDILFSRIVNPPVPKTSAIRLEGDWTLEFTNL